MQTLIEAVQRNCDIADANHAGDDSLCIYLLKMRDFYRWHESHPLNVPVDREVLGEWIIARESRWDDVEEQSYESLVIDGRAYDVFDNANINLALNSKGYVYSGGLGPRSRPMFFLAELVQHQSDSAANIMVSDRELARCIIAPPGLSQQGGIYIRKDALRRYLGAMVEDWGWKQRPGPMNELINHYQFLDDFDRAMGAMVENEMENVILHEIGEQIAGELIGEGWQVMLGNLDHPVKEFKARAIRDNLADCTATLPAFLTFDDHASIDFYYANMTPLRKKLFPSFCEAYEAARKKGGDYSRMKEVVKKGRLHWLKLGRRLVERDQQGDWDALGLQLENSAF